MTAEKTQREQDAKEFLAARIANNSNTSSEEAHRMAAETARRVEQKEKK